MDKIPIVDLNDEIIYYKDRKEGVVWPEIHRTAALWLKNSKGEVLLAQRAFTKRIEPGKWGPAVAGTVEKGETYEANIIKEIREEIGLTGLHLTESWKRPPSKDKPTFGQWYLATIDMPAEKFKINKEEVVAVEWFSKDRLLRELKTHPEKFIPNLPEYVERFMK